MTVYDRNPWLDLCRALAITLLLLGHGRLFLIADFPPLDALRAASFIGVELFFVLSGFLIGGILLESAITSRPGWLSNFYARRWWRTLPNFYLFLGLNAGLSLAGIRPADLSVFWQYPLFTQSLLWPSPPFFSEAWSLAIEEVFYLLFPLAFVSVAWLFRLDRVKAFLFVAGLVLLLSPLARAIAATSDPSWDEGVRKVTLLRLDAIMVGVIFAWVWRNNAIVLTKWSIKLPLLLALVFSVVFVAAYPPQILDQSFFAKTLLFTFAPLGCAFIVVSGLHFSLPQKIRRSTAFLARISYSAYLANIPVATLMVFLWPAQLTGGISRTAMFLIFMAATLVVSWGVYQWFERRFLALREHVAPVGLP
jgi:peptidoglycan/LPS O-acetylase OafA/YrhL